MDSDYKCKYKYVIHEQHLEMATKMSLDEVRGTAGDVLVCNYRDCTKQHLHNIFAESVRTQLIILIKYFPYDCLCSLVVRVPGYRSSGLGVDSWRYQIFWEVVGLE
jgi:hypothetical protein